MLSVAEFYHPDRWAGLHGIKGPHYGPTGHRGHDIAWPPREPIPALRAGRVVLVAYSSILGWYLVIEVGPDDYDGYCHIVNPAKWGAWVEAGGYIGEVAGWDDDHGSAWVTPHVHVTNGPNVSSVHTDPRRDPRPIIEAARFSFAGGGIEEIVTAEMVKNALYEARGNDGRNLFDSVIQTRNELFDRAREASADTLYKERVQGRNVFDFGIQILADIAALRALVAAGDATLRALIEKIGQQGITVDAAEIQAAAKAGADAAVRGLDIPTAKEIAEATLGAQERAELVRLTAEVERLRAQLTD